MPVLMSQVDQLQEAEQHVAQRQEEEARVERAAREADLRTAPLSDTASKPHSAVTAPLRHVSTMVNMRVGLLPGVHELAVSIKESGLLHPPLVRGTGDEEHPYELLAGRRRFAAMQLLDQAEGPRSDWRFTLVDGITRREALTIQFAENFHQAKPEPVQFARAARAIMGEDPSLTAADVSRLVARPSRGRARRCGCSTSPPRSSRASSRATSPSPSPRSCAVASRAATCRPRAPRRSSSSTPRARSPAGR